jgi:YfiH family protein
MSLSQVDAIQYYQFPLFNRAGVLHGVITRQGGVSPQPWDSLNSGATVGDSLENVQENRRRSLAAFGKEIGSMYDSWLVHGTRVIIVQAPRSAGETYQKADIVLTDRPEVTLYMRFADCVPILLYDPIKRVAGLAHAGWVGSLNGVARAAVEAMVSRYGANPKDILAGIGPSICVDHYPVGDEVVEQVRNKLPDHSSELVIYQEGKPHLDLWKTNQAVLEHCGVRQIEISGLCTACDTHHWYSHRAEAGKTGRFGALIALGN